MADEVLSDVHIFTQHESAENCHGVKEAVSRFVFSLPKSLENVYLNEPDEDGDSNENSLDEDGDIVVRRKRRKDVSHAITICHKLETKLDCVGLQVWNGCLLLCDYILHYHVKFKGQTILDLGAGVGLTSILAAMFGSKVYCTDMCEDILSIARRNVELNSHLLSDGCKSVDIREVDWMICENEKYIPSLNNKDVKEMNILLAAEVIYDIDITSALFSTLQFIFKSETPKLLYISLEKRLIFTKEDLDVVSPAYSHFRECLDLLISQQPSDIVMEYSQIPCDFPQYFTYHRIQELELWQISSSLPKG